MPTVNSIMDEDGSLSLIGLLRNNIFACAICVGMGLVPFLFLPVWAIISNAMIIGALLGLGASTGRHVADESHCLWTAAPWRL